MNVRRIIIILIFLTPSLFGCGYQSIYKSGSNQNFYIENLNLNGDDDIANYLQKKLNSFDDKNSRPISVDITINFNKQAVTKDKTGNITNVQLSANVNLLVVFNKQTKNYVFRESLKIEKNSDNFQQLKYEKNIKETLSEIIFKKIIFYLQNLE